MSRRIICVIYALLYLSSCVDKAQSLRNNPQKKATQLSDVWKRAAREGDEEESPSSTTEVLKKMCSCSKIYDPVCASNGNSYYNLCQMECDSGTDKNVTVVHQGNCIPFRRTITIRV